MEVPTTLLNLIAVTRVPETNWNLDRANERSGEARQLPALDIDRVQKRLFANRIPPPLSSTSQRWRPAQCKRLALLGFNSRGHTRVCASNDESSKSGHFQSRAHCAHHAFYSPTAASSSAFLRDNFRRNDPFGELIHTPAAGCENWQRQHCPRL